MRLAADRGASAAAAELAELALRLTPPEDAGGRHRRALVGARAHQAAGEWTRARAITTDLLAEVELGPVRAEALVLLAALDVIDGIALLESALREADSSPALQSVVHCRLAWAKRFKTGFEHARAALELAEQLDDDVLRARARSVEAILGGSPASRKHRMIFRTAFARFGGAVGGEQLVREATLAVVNTLAPSSKRGRPVLCSSASTTSGASATSRGAPAHSGASRGSSSGPGGGRSRPHTPPTRTTSRSSTGSSCRRTTFRSL